MRAIISVTGKDGVGIIAAVSNVCAQFNANIQDVSQTVMQEYFAMIMLVDISDLKGTFFEFSDAMKKLGEEKALDVHTMHEDVCNAMHRV